MAYSLEYQCRDCGEILYQLPPGRQGCTCGGTNGFRVLCDETFSKRELMGYDEDPRYGDETNEHEDER